MSKKKSKEKQPKEKPQKKPIEVWYTEDGTKIGDDGYPMTPIRTRMHNLWNGYFIWAILCVVICIVCIVVSYLQGQQFTDWELIASGGNTINGYETATLIRIEGLLALWTAVAAVIVNLKGFQWMYDNAGVSVLNGLLYAGLGIGIVLELVALIFIHIPDPLSILNICLVAFTLYTMKRTEEEKPTLHRPKKHHKVEK